MNVKQLFLMVICTLYYAITFAQAPTPVIKKNQLEFSTGFTSGSLKNLAFAPVSRYDYTGLNYQLKYARTTTNENLFEAQITYIDTELKSDLFPMLNAPYSKAVLNISYLKKVYTKNKFAIQVGLQTQTNVSSYYRWRVYDIQQKLGVAGRFSYQIDNKQSLSSKLTIPFFMWRTSTFEEKYYSLKRYQSMSWHTAYTYALSNRFDCSASYNLNYDRLQISNAYRELQHTINLGITYKF